MDFDTARKLVAPNLSAAIVHLENDNEEDFNRYALILAHVLGMVRGSLIASAKERGEEGQIVHRMHQALFARDLSALWDLEKEWAEFRSGPVQLRLATSGNGSVIGGGTG